MIYTRTDEEAIEIPHLVVQDDYTTRGKNAGEGLAFLLVEELCRVGRRIRGVPNVRFAYDPVQVILKPIQVAAPQTGNA
jgi:hypothetical protein